VSPLRGHRRAAAAIGGASALALATIAIALVIGLIAVAPGATAIIVDAATLQGTISAPDGTPLPGARVEVKGLTGTNATAGPDGLYSISVPTSTAGYTLHFTAVDRAPVERPTGPVAPLAIIIVNATLALYPPSAVLRIDILPYAQPGETGLREDYIEVTNATGTPGFHYRERVSTAAVTVPAPGGYVVKATRPGYYDGTVEVSVRRGDDRSVTVDLTDLRRPTHGVISGTVRHGTVGLSNATVTAQATDGGHSYEARTDLAGNYTLEVPPGNYSVRADAEGYARVTRATSVQAGRASTLDIALPLEVEQGGLGGTALAWAGLVAAIVVLGAVAAYAALTSRRARRAKGAEKAAATTLECPACGAAAPSDADVCPGCGARFPWRSFRCPECGSPLPLDATRCAECGNTRFDLHRG
jgi:hypothetical protein